MNNDVNICIKDDALKDRASKLADKLNTDITDEIGDGLTVLFDENGVSLTGYGLTYRGDFSTMLRRVEKGRVLHEMLAKAAKTSEVGLNAIDATAGMGEDSFILAAYGYNVTMYEQNPVVAELLRDSLLRAKNDPKLKEIVSRMTLIEGDSIELMSKALNVDLIYLDPMFPKRQKSGLINKKLQLIQKLEPPCSTDIELFDAAIVAGPKKIIVKRPLKSPNLAGRKPNYKLDGKAIRYDCYAL